MGERRKKKSLDLIIQKKEKSLDLIIQRKEKRWESEFYHEKIFVSSSRV